MNFAIIGCGFIAKKHAIAISKVENARLVAVCDKVPTMMEPYVKDYGAKAYNEMNDMFESENIDIVCICTPSSLHAPIAIEVAAWKKNIILEKPIAMTLEETDEIIGACEKNNVKLSVVHPNRFRPVVQKLKQILDEDQLGKISHVNCTVNWNRNQEYYDQAPWRGTKEHDGGVLMNQAIHNIDLLLWFMGDVEEVFSMEATRIRDIEAEDVSTGVVRFKSGVLGVVETSTTVYPKNYEESITIFGEKGTVKIGGQNALYFKDIEIEGRDSMELVAIQKEVENNPWGIPGHQWIIKDMIQAIQEESDPAVTGEDGRKALEFVNSFYESAKKNQPIRISEEINYEDN